MGGPEPPGFIRVRQVNDAESADQVFLALRVADAGEVAVRVYGRAIRAQRDRTRFEEEAAALITLAASPHVLAIESIGFTDTHRPFVVTEFCHSGSLHEHLTTVGRLTPTEVRRIGAKLALALAEAHRHNIIHRRVKPTNVLIDSRGEPALTDFGLASLATSDGRFMPPRSPETHPFTAPEAFLPELMTPAADIFSLGATLYSLLAGWGPRTLNPLAVAVDGDTLADLPKVPWALMSVVRTAMALDPARRYPDAAAMAVALLA